MLLRLNHIRSRRVFRHMIERTLRDYWRARIPSRTIWRDRDIWLRYDIPRGVSGVVEVIQSVLSVSHRAVWAKREQQLEDLPTDIRSMLPRRLGTCWITVWTSQPRWRIRKYGAQRRLLEIRKRVGTYYNQCGGFGTMGRREGCGSGS